MDGLMMDFPLTLTHLMRRAEAFFGDGEIVTRLPDKSFHRTNHRDTLRRARQLAVALQKIGLERGDRVATLCWNHHQHHEAYFGVPCGGFVLHTLNLRLHPNDLNYIASHAGDRAVIVDRALLPLLEKFREGTPIEHVWVVEDSYEELLATGDPDEWEDPELDENEAAAMCYTSGTTGRPRGVVYSHRSSVLHALGVGANNPLGLGFGIDDAVMPVVPMFHANAWGYPYLATMQGAKLVYPGPHLDPDSLLENMEQEHVTWAAGVPTIWMGILARLDAEPGRWDLSAMKAMLVGGSAVPRAMIAAFESRHGLRICQGWGMTETSPSGTFTPMRGMRKAGSCGIPVPGATIKFASVTDPTTYVPLGERGEICIKGPNVMKGYWKNAQATADVMTADGFLRTGDVGYMDADGFVFIVDRIKDMLLCGGYNVYPRNIEEAIYTHPAVAEVSVIGIPDEYRGQSPKAFIALKPGATPFSLDELKGFLKDKLGKHEMIGVIEFRDSLPKTAVGKILKTALYEEEAQRRAAAPAKV